MSAWPTASACALLCALSLLPERALAQPVFVELALLHAGADEVGWLGSAHADVRGWPGERRATLHFEDEVIQLEADVDLADRESRLLATPGETVTLEPAREFRVDMLPLTFARVERQDAAGRMRVRLPSELPHRGAAMPVGSAAAASLPPAEPRAPRGDSWQTVCQEIEVLSRPRRDARTWRVDGSLTSVRAIAEPPDRRGYHRVRVWVAGFIVHGFLKRPLPPHGCGFGSFSSGCGGALRTGHVRVTLPVGTALFGSPSATASFATLRSPWTAELDQAGAIPDTPAAWRLRRDADHGARWALSAWLRMTPAALRALPNAD